MVTNRYYRLVNINTILISMTFKFYYKKAYQKVRHNCPPTLLDIQMTRTLMPVIDVKEETKIGIKTNEANGSLMAF